MRKSARAVLTLLLALPAPAAAAEPAELSLSSILGRGEEVRLGAEALAEGPGGVLAAVAGTDRFPIPCATPVMQLLAGPDRALAPPLRQAYSAAAERPDLGDTRVVLTRDGQFALHYSSSARTSGLMSADRDRNGQPDLIDRLSEALPASRGYLTGRLGYPPPAPEGVRVDVFVTHLGHGLDGFAVPGRETAGGPPAPSGFIVLDADLTAERVMPAAFHQVAHLSLSTLSSRTSPWWSEASATYLTVMGTGDLESHEAGLRARLQSHDRGLLSDSLLLMQGSLLWPLFLAERTADFGVLRQIWGELADQGNDPLAATDAVLRRSAGMSLAEAFREYAAWNLFTGKRDVGGHYSIGRSLPESPLTAIEPGPPFLLSPIEPVEPLGSIAFRLQGDRNQGSLDLEIGAEGGHPEVDLLVFYDGEGPLPALVPAPLSADGAGRVAIPWGHARETWIVLRNRSTAPGDASSFRVRGSIDPYAPYDLASYTAQASRGSILLEWTTASEKGLVGWNVYRGEGPTGPFSRLNSVAIPAFGDGAAETGYIFIDDSPRPGKRYYYRIEGFTGLGLAERSQVVSGRIPLSP